MHCTIHVVLSQRTHWSLSTGLAMVPPKNMMQVISDTGVKKTYHNSTLIQQTYHNATLVQQTYHNSTLVQQTYHNATLVQQTYHNSTLVQQTYHKDQLNVRCMCCELCMPLSQSYSYHLHTCTWYVCVSTLKHSKTICGVRFTY